MLFLVKCSTVLTCEVAINFFQVETRSKIQLVRSTVVKVGFDLI